MIQRVVIVGAGRAGRGLTRALRASGVEVRLKSRREETDDPDAARPLPIPLLAGGAEAVLIAVRDGQLADAITEVVDARLDAQVTVLQLSGSAPDAGLEPLRRRGHAAGTFHPLVALSEPSRSASALRGAWIGVGGDERAVRAAGALAAILGSHTLTVPLPDPARARYHAAAVFASNFPVVLAAIAERLFVESGVSAEAARGAVGQLAVSAANALQDRDPADALTGPVARGDVTTIERHLVALADDAEADTAYRALTGVALDRLAPLLGPAVSEELRRALAPLPAGRAAG